MKDLVRIEDVPEYRPDQHYTCKCGGEVAYFDLVTLTGYCRGCYMLGRDVWDRTRIATVRR